VYGSAIDPLNLLQQMLMELEVGVGVGACIYIPFFLYHCTGSVQNNWCLTIFIFEQQSLQRCLDVYIDHMKTKIGHAVDSSRMILNKMRPRVFKLFAGWYVNRSHPGGLLRDDITPTHSQTIIRFWALVTIMQTNFNYFVGGRMKTSFPPSFSICFFSLRQARLNEGIVFLF